MSDRRNMYATANTSTSTVIDYDAFEPVQRGDYSNIYAAADVMPFTPNMSSMQSVPIEKERIKDAVKELFDEFIGEIKDGKVDVIDFYNMYSDLMHKHQELLKKNEILEVAIIQSQLLIDQCKDTIDKLQESINLLGFEKLLLEN